MHLHLPKGGLDTNSSSIIITTQDGEDLFPLFQFLFQHLDGENVEVQLDPTEIIIHFTS